MAPPRHNLPEVPNLIVCDSCKGTGVDYPILSPSTYTKDSKAVYRINCHRNHVLCLRCMQLNLDKSSMNCILCPEHRENIARGLQAEKIKVAQSHAETLIKDDIIAAHELVRSAYETLFEAMENGKDVNNNDDTSDEDDGRRFRCPKAGCGKAFSTRKGLSDHLGMHDRQCQLVCTICESTFGSKPNLARHQKICTGVKRIKRLQPAITTLSDADSKFCTAFAYFSCVKCRGVPEGEAISFSGCLHKFCSDCFENIKLSSPHSCSACSCPLSADNKSPTNHLSLLLEGLKKVYQSKVGPLAQMQLSTLFKDAVRKNLASISPFVDGGSNFDTLISKLPVVPADRPGYSGGSGARIPKKMNRMDPALAESMTALAISGPKKPTNTATYEGMHVPIVRLTRLVGTPGASSAIKKPLEETSTLTTDSMPLIFLADDKDNRLKQLATKTKLRCAAGLSNDVECIVWNVEPHDPLKISLLYLEGMLCGAWYLSYKWLESMPLRLTKSIVVPFEVGNTVEGFVSSEHSFDCTSARKRARRSRREQGQLLFDALDFYIDSEASYESNDLILSPHQIRTLIEKGGGNVVNRIPRNVDPSTGGFRAHLHHGHALNQVSLLVLFGESTSLVEKYDTKAIKSLHVSWVVDSIMNFKLSAPDSFLSKSLRK